MGSFEFFDHTADVGMRVSALSFEDLLATAGRGLAAVLVLKPTTLASSEHRTVSVCEAESSLLLFDFLNELLYLFEAERFLARDVKVRLGKEGQLTADLAGETFDPDRHCGSHEIKAITYHGLFVEQTADGWRAEVIFDI